MDSARYLIKTRTTAVWISSYAGHASVVARRKIRIVRVVEIHLRYGVRNVRARFRNPRTIVEIRATPNGVLRRERPFASSPRSQLPSRFLKEHAILLTTILTTSTKWILVDFYPSRASGRLGYRSHFSASFFTHSFTHSLPHSLTPPPTQKSQQSLYLAHFSTDSVQITFG